MKLFKLMASVCAVSAAFMFAACDDSSSASSNDEPSASNDCSVEDGVKVVSPKKGDSFKPLARTLLLDLPDPPARICPWAVYIRDTLSVSQKIFLRRSHRRDNRTQCIYILP